MTESSLETQRDDLVDRLTRTREGYRRCISDVSTEVANRGSEWSIVDLLLHVTESYRSMLTRILEEDNPDLGGTYDPDAAWKRVTDTLLGNIDGAIRIVTDMTPAQMGRAGQRGGQDIGVLDVVALMAKHYDEHLNQLRDEIRARENLSPIS